IIGCSPRDRLNYSDVIINISPTSQTILQGQTLNFAAKVYNRKGKLINKNVVWSTNYGTIRQDGLYISPSNIKNPITVEIKAIVDNVVSSINLRIVKVLPITEKRFYFFADEKLDLQDLKLDTLNPPDANGGYLGIIGSGSVSISRLTVTDSSVEKVFEGDESLEIDFQGAYPNSGIYFQFGYDGDTNPNVDSDFSNYKKLNFAFKIESFEPIAFSVKLITEGQLEAIHTITNFSDYMNWKEIYLDIATIFPRADMSKFKQLIFCTNGKVYLDNIYFEE
ncbi:hypothetical protein ACFL5N_02800, partial [bacterium]